VLEAFQFAAILSCGIFAGAALYINLVEHPARMQCGTELASTVFGPSYHRATRMQVPLALIATISAAGSWWFEGSMLWIVGAVIIFAVETRPVDEGMNTCWESRQGSPCPDRTV